MEITTRLEKLAYNKTTAFCYSCYCQAPSGLCLRCGSDDLMRELPGVGVEYGVDWVIESLLRDLAAVNTAEAFAESVSQCYPETTEVGWLKLNTVTILKECDPISWRIAEGEWIDAELSEGNLFSPDNGNTNYWTHEVEKFLDESEEDAA